MKTGFYALTLCAYGLAFVSGPAAPWLLAPLALWSLWFARAAVHGFFAFAGSGIHVGLRTWARMFLLAALAGFLLGWALIPLLLVRDLLASARREA